MTPVSLEAFVHENRRTFPTGVDLACKDTPIPVTMARYGMRGTPTLIVIRRNGTVYHHGFGQQDDMAIGAMIAAVLGET